jgi:hypothetical protein
MIICCGRLEIGMTFQIAPALCARYRILTGAWGRAVHVHVHVHADDISGLNDVLQEDIP